MNQIENSIRQSGVVTREIEDIVDSIEFGTKMTESFEQYVTRVEGEIDKWVTVRGGLSEGLATVIIGIFKDIVYNINGVKFKQIYQLLKRNLKREPVDNDLDNLVKLVETRIMQRTINYISNDREREKRLR